MKTIYPEGFVQMKCFTCGHKTTPVRIPEKTTYVTLKEWVK